MDLSLRSRSRKRLGIAGVLGAVLMFAMLFTVGTGFFIFINSSNLVYNQALTQRSNGMQTQLSEQLVISATGAIGGKINFTVQNTGGVAVVVRDLFVYTPSNGLCTFGPDFASNPNCPVNLTNTSPALPIAVSPSTTSVVISTGITYLAGTYTLKVTTQSGNTFTATYPPTSTVLASNALTSGAIGYLYLKFGSYSYYGLTSGGSCPSSGPTTSGYCLQLRGLAFTIPHSITGALAFSVTVTNLEPNQQTITLDNYSLMVQFLMNKGDEFKPTTWYVASISNQTNSVCSSSPANTICANFSKLALPYNVPVTIVFASADAGSFQCKGYNSVPSGCDNSFNPSTGTTAGIFIVSHGWNGTPCSPLTLPCSNYGQNTPYVATVYS